jgi:uncharacterized protein YaaR (DUF327 family)
VTQAGGRMERIESVDGSRLSERSRRKKNKSAKKSAGRGFRSVVEQAADARSAPFDLDDQEHARTLEGLLDELHESGEALLQTQSLDNIRKYRQAVRAFLDHVVNGMLAVDEQVSGGSVLRRKRFTQVKVVDGKLERLAAEVLQNQGRQLDLLEKINEIRGLLVDLIT